MKNSLVMFCSGTGFTREAMAFLAGQVPPEEGDFDILAVPGCIYSLAASHEDFGHHRSSLGEQVVFLVEKHSLGRVIVLDHSECAWFDELERRDKAFTNRTPEVMLKKTVSKLKGILPKKTALSVFKGIKTVAGGEVVNLSFHPVSGL